VQYMNSGTDQHPPITTWFFWGWNANSVDTGVPWFYKITTPPSVHLPRQCKFSLHSLHTRHWGHRRSCLVIKILHSSYQTRITRTRKSYKMCSLVAVNHMDVPTHLCFRPLHAASPFKGACPCGTCTAGVSLALEVVGSALVFIVLQKSQTTVEWASKHE
jgi:hypothetical protein